MTSLSHRSVKTDGATFGRKQKPSGVYASRELFSRLCKSPEGVGTVNRIAKPVKHWRGETYPLQAVRIG
ncbi:MAG: hypothetical protein GY749_23510 [Desulfobacteraceae bacterium]|nr:hypothetical protein [Desulfobacteraceae bacterium]